MKEEKYYRWVLLIMTVSSKTRSCEAERNNIVYVGLIRTYRFETGFLLSMSGNELKKKEG